ncbi:MAG TPA: GNAT family N-acetyltransferase [Cyclobacteriaceae bacterium]
MIIRQAIIADALAIQSLLGQLGYPDFTTEQAKEKIIAYEKDSYRLLVGEVNGEVVTFIALHWFDLLHWKGKAGRITSFCVDEKFRSQGIGQKMIEYSEKLMFDEGCIKLEVTSNQRRTRAHEFYLNLDYIEDSRRFVKLRK